MTYRPPGRTPIRNLHQDSNDNQFFERFIDLPLEIRTMIYREYLDNLGTISPDQQDTQPALTRASSQLREESLPVYYRHNTFAAVLNTWPPPTDDDENPLTSLDFHTTLFVDCLLEKYLARMTHVSLAVNFDTVPCRRFVVHFNLRQWQITHMYDRSVRIERIVPARHVAYDDYFYRGVDFVIRTVFDEIRSVTSGDPLIRRCLRMTEHYLYPTFHDYNAWNNVAAVETGDALQRMQTRLAARYGLILWVSSPEASRFVNCS
jgi:hypothetical protein